MVVMILVSFVFSAIFDHQGCFSFHRRVEMKEQEGDAISNSDSMVSPLARNWNQVDYFRDEKEMAMFLPPLLPIPLLLQLHFALVVFLHLRRQLSSLREF